VTFGQSFHWTNEQRVAETVYDMLEPGGAAVGVFPGDHGGFLAFPE